MRTRTRVVEQGRTGRGERLARVLWGAAEAAVTLGVVVLLLVAHQLWWTNQQARADAEGTVEALERSWQDGPAATQDGPAGAGAGPRADSDDADDADDADGSAGGDDRAGDDGPASAPGAGPGEDAAPDPSRWAGAYAVLRIPGIGVTAPVAEGVGKSGVLDKGYVGHYPRTDGPGAAGNFALAGHRNTHGEPFRRLDRLRPGDEVRVETADARYVYEVSGTVPETLPGDGTVLRRIPYSSVHPERRMTGPGHYLTLTTCTPEYTSKYRLVVWGELRRAEPR